MKNNKKSGMLSRCTAFLLTLLMILPVLASCGDGQIDLMSDDLSKYISISEADYKSFPVDSPLKEYSESDLVRKINQILVKNKSTKPLHDGLGTRNIAISLGDEVSMYYRGYTVDENGEQKPVDGSCNFTTSAATLVIGSGNFIPGFEEGLIGKIPSEHGKFFRIGSGKPAADNVVYLTYYSFSENSNKNVSYERLDLSRTDIDEEYGAGFTEFILSSEIGKDLGAQTFTLGNGSVGYQGLKIEFATDCENAPITVDVKFPENYDDTELRGVEAKFDVFIEYSIIYDTDEFDATFIKDRLGVKESDLTAYQGADVVEKYKNKLREEVKADIEKANDEIKTDAMWEHYLKKVTINEIPQDEIDNCYNNFYNEVNSAYNENTDTYNSIDEVAVPYLNSQYSLGLSSGDDWRAALSRYSEEIVKKELIFYYLIRKEGFLPNESEYEALYSEIYEEHVEYHLNQQAADLATLDKESYAAYVEDLRADVKEYYGDAYFRESVYYRYGVSKLVGYAKVS